MKEMKIPKIYILFFMLLVFASFSMQADDVGPSKGSLVIVGGSMQDPAIFGRFLPIPPDGKFYFLAPGDRFDLEKREAQRPSRTMRPIGRVQKKE